MKRWQIIGICAAALAVGGYFYFFHTGLRQLASSRVPHEDKPSEPPAPRPARLNWQTVNRADAGFSVEMPSDPMELQVPAFTENGSTEPVRMIFTDVESDTTFAVTWQDNPPVARVNDRIPDKTLDAARNGMLSRTQTTLDNETRVTISGYPGREITARNAGGGVLDARLIYTGERLYTLLALFPSRSAKREQDVIRFYNSFSPSHFGSPSAGPSGT